MTKHPEPTRAQAKKFVEIRNASEFTSNLQVAFDASEAGFSVDGLPKPTGGGDEGYEWKLSHGRITEDRRHRWAYIPN